MAAGSTYTPISSTTLGSSTATVTLSSISSSYTDLVLVIVSAVTVTSNDLRLQFNGDTNSNYSTTTLYGTGSAAGSARETSTTSILLDYYAAPDTTLGKTVHLVSINNYSNTTTYKTLLSRANKADSGVDANVGLWRSTSAINSISIFSNGRSIAAGSTFTLYGITAA